MLKVTIGYTAFLISEEYSIAVMEVLNNCHAVEIYTRGPNGEYVQHELSTKQIECVEKSVNIITKRELMELKDAANG